MGRSTIEKCEKIKTLLEKAGIRAEHEAPKSEDGMHTDKRVFAYTSVISADVLAQIIFQGIDDISIRRDLKDIPYFVFTF